MKKINELSALTTYTGHDAIFIRHFMEHYISSEDKEPWLRDCQDEGNAAVIQFKPDGLSVTYIGKLSRSLKKVGVINTHKKGRSWVVTDGPHIDKFVEFLASDEEYGMRISGTAQQDLDRIKATRIIDEYGALAALQPDHPMPPAAYGLLNQRVRAGELIVAFIEPELLAAVKHQGKTRKVKFWDDYEIDDEGDLNVK